MNSGAATVNAYANQRGNQTAQNKRPWIHRIYYLLAALDLFAVLSGLFLSHHINGVLKATVAENHEWSALHGQVSEIRRAAGDINAPGNDIFESKDAGAEINRLNQAIAAYTPKMTALRAAVDRQLPGELKHRPVEALAGVGNAMAAMIATSQTLLEHYRAGDPDAAVLLMPSMDRSYSVALGHIEDATQVFRAVENEIGVQKSKDVEALQVFEYLLGAFVVLMVTIVAVYGHKIGKVFLEQYKQVQSFNSQLEERIRERTADLEQANTEIEQKMRHLKEAQEEKQKQDERIKAQHIQLAAAIENMHHGISMFSADGKLLVYNANYAQIYSMPQDSLYAGMPLSEILELQRDSSSIAADDIASSGGTVERQSGLDPESWEIELSDGRYIQISRRPLADGGWVTVHMDITESKKAEALEQSLVREQELNKLQRQFVSMASHEFRTPLSIIDMTAQRLVRRAQQQSPDETIERANNIRDAVRRMSMLMESTLTVARLEEGKVSINIKPCDLQVIVRRICARQQEINDSHTINCNVDDLPPTIKGDTGALEQVFTNLLSNAVKYSPDAPRIDVHARRDGDEVLVSVRDQGLGIDEEDMDKMFGRFFRAKTSVGIAGTGIGLHLVRSLVELHGGSIGIQSKKGQGSTFTVRLPIDGPSAVAEPERHVA